jgi:tetratricopeptide (TPR) repeat protein
MRPPGVSAPPAGPQPLFEDMKQHLRSRRNRHATFLRPPAGCFVALWVLLFGCLGCRSLRRGQPDIGASQARHFSLRGADALQLNKYDDAETLFAEALRRCPTDERAHWGMAEVQWHRGNCQAAAYHMEEASRMSGNNPDLSVRLGEMHLQAGRLAEASLQAEAVLTQHRQHAGAWQLQGQILEQQEKWQEAIQCYHRALMSKPNNPTVQLALAGIYQRLGRPQRALATLERMSDLQANEYNSAKTWLLKGQALASLGQIEEAKTCLKDAASQANPEDGALFLKMAHLQAEVGELAEARVNLGRALSLSPNHPEALALRQQLDRHFANLTASNTAILTTHTAPIGPWDESESSQGGTVPARVLSFEKPHDSPK